MSSSVRRALNWAKSHEFDGMDELQEDLATTEERLECPAEMVSAVRGLWIKLDQHNVLVKFSGMCCSDRHTL